MPKFKRACPYKQAWGQALSRKGVAMLGFREIWSASWADIKKCLEGVKG